MALHIIIIIIIIFLSSVGVSDGVKKN